MAALVLQARLGLCASQTVGAECYRSKHTLTNRDPDPDRVRMITIGRASAREHVVSDTTPARASRGWDVGQGEWDRQEISGGQSPRTS